VTLVASRLSGFATLSLILELVAIHFPWDLCDQQMAEVAVPRQMFAEILSLIARLRAPSAPA
jgi:hypothetical protein